MIDLNELGVLCESVAKRPTSLRLAHVLMEKANPEAVGRLVSALQEMIHLTTRNKEIAERHGIAAHGARAQRWGWRYPTGGVDHLAWPSPDAVRNSVRGAAGAPVRLVELGEGETIVSDGLVAELHDLRAAHERLVRLCESSGLAAPGENNKG